MAHHGGPKNMPRAHRPRAPIMSAPAPLTAPLAPLRSGSSSSTLPGAAVVASATNSTLMATTTATATHHHHHHHHHPHLLPQPLLSSSSPSAAVAASAAAASASTSPLQHHHLQQQQQPLLSSLSPLLGAATTTMSSSSASGLPQVSLVAPRPDSERRSNEYVETPFRVHHHRDVPPPPLPTTASSPPPPPRVQRPARLPIPPPTLPTSLAGAAAATAAATVTKQPQPTAATFCKEPQVSPICDTRQSIICGECGRCSCPSCQQPRPLPECWTSTYRCSADTIIDYASCLCCVKGLFYHCSETDGGDTCVDEPCNCGPDRRTARWGCLAALSCVLPCLLFYWPLQCGKRVVETCYARHSRLGCRCRPKTSTSSAVAAAAALVGSGSGGGAAINTPEKRLLDVSPDF